MVFFVMLKCVYPICCRYDYRLCFPVYYVHILRLKGLWKLGRFFLWYKVSSPGEEVAWLLLVKCIAIRTLSSKVSWHAMNWAVMTLWQILLIISRLLSTFFVVLWWIELLFREISERTVNIINYKGEDVTVRSTCLTLLKLENFSTEWRSKSFAFHFNYSMWINEYNFRFSVESVLNINTTELGQMNEWRRL